MSDVQSNPIVPLPQSDKAHGKPTRIYLLELATQSDDKMKLIVEATSPEQATQMANSTAIQVGYMDEFDMADQDPEVFFYTPQCLGEPTGEADVFMID